MTGATMATYALITSSVITNIIVADLTFINSISSQYDFIIDITGIIPSPQITWNYIGGVFSDPTTLATAKSQKLALLQTDVQNFIDAHYLLLTRTQLMNLYTLAVFDGLTNRATYLRPGIDWINSIIAYSVSTSSTIKGFTTLTDLNSFNYDIQSNVSADPLLTIGAALQISN